MNLNAIFSLALVAGALTTFSAFAQERAAGSAIETQMNWTALKSLVEQANTNSGAVDTRLTQNETCNRKNMVYSPKSTNPTPDTNGCIDNKLLVNLTKRVDTAETNIDGNTANINQLIACAKKGALFAGVKGSCKAAKTPTPADLDLRAHTETKCTRDNGPFNVISDCATGEALLSCNGGPGDQDESSEYWVLEPDYKKNRCIGRVRSPRCWTDKSAEERYYSQVIVTAVCYKPED